MTKRSYTTNTGDLTLEHGSRQYHLKVQDLPTQEKPREKLLEKGPGALAMAELLAVLLGVGTKKEEVMAMSRRLLHEYGQQAVAHQQDPRVLSAAVDIPLGKACQIVACFELGRRLYKEQVPGRQQAFLRTPEQVVEYVTDMRSLPKEQLRGLYLNAHFGLIHDEVLSIGTLTGSMVHPREVFAPALAYGASGIILVHNHPSGVAEPSKADIQVTEQLIEAGKILGVTLLDHVIVTSDTSMSIPVAYDVPTI